MTTSKISLRRFWLQVTKSFTEGAPQRENYVDDRAFGRACVAYGHEWRLTYHCEGCDEPECPQCSERGKLEAKWGITHPSETIGGVPLGLSRDYEHLPLNEPLRSIRCQTCSRQYEDAERLLEDGVRICAVMCLSCREEGRARWIAEKIETLELPSAVATYRGGLR